MMVTTTAMAKKTTTMILYIYRYCIYGGDMTHYNFTAKEHFSESAREEALF